MFKKLIIGLLAGFICGFFSTGGGLILVPAFVYRFKLNEGNARATSMFAIIPMVIVSSFFYYNSDYINWDIGIKAAIGGCIGAVIGAKLLKKLSNNILRITFTIFLVYMGARMLIVG